MLKRFPGPRKGRPYVAVVRAGDMVYTAGYTGFETDGTVPEDFGAQVRLILDKARANLERAGSSLDRVVSVTVYLTDQERDREALDAAFREAFAHAPPARATVEVKALSDPAKRVEMQFVAHADRVAGE
ncbi:MAG: RidA family protein [Azospirillaceae bacterium]